MDRPLNIAHRGGANLWPENTLEAFDNAINAGVDGIECDILSHSSAQVFHSYLFSYRAAYNHPNKVQLH